MYHVHVILKCQKMDFDLNSRYYSIQPYYINVYTYSEY